MRLHRCWLSLALWLSLPAFAPANTAAPWRSGQSVGEPGGLQSVRIDRETLTLDLRGFKHAGPAKIEATYHLYNTGDTLTTDLVFVVGSLLGEGDGAGVWLDDQPVPHERDAKPALPPSWQPPKQTPALPGGRPMHYSASGSALAFKVSLPPGAHQLRVKYLARPSAYSAGSPTLYWQLGYVLAPARDWAGFGKLDVKVTLPEGWSAACEPPLDRQGDELTGSFQGVPADALALTVQAPPRTPAWLLTAINWTCALLALLAAPVLIWRLSGALGRKLAVARQTSGLLVVCALLAGLLWSATLVAAVFTASFASSELAALPHQKAWAVDYGPVFFFFLALLGAAALAPLGTGLSLVAG
ncbi:MAG: hypothetical protein JNM56_08865, partial [Planctomycetia bacterium]|nr:hypothetical protein [Planctomycetia bacterium]